MYMSSSVFLPLTWSNYWYVVVVWKIRLREFLIWLSVNDDLPLNIFSLKKCRWSWMEWNQILRWLIKTMVIFLTAYRLRKAPITTSGTVLEYELGNRPRRINPFEDFVLDFAFSMKILMNMSEFNGGRRKNVPRARNTLRPDLTIKNYLIDC